MSSVRSRFGDGIRTRPARSGFAWPTSSKTVYFIPDEAGTVAHIYWNGSALVDTKGNIWTMNGTVPQVAASGQLPAGAGPFSDANYYSLGTGNDVLDFAGDFSGCVFYGAKTAAWKYLASNGASTTEGYFVQDQNGPMSATVCRSGTNVTASSSPTSQDTTGPNVFCFGRTSTTMVAKLNLGAYHSSGATGAIAPGTSHVAMIGRNDSAGGAYGGTIFEFWFSSTTPSDALFTTIMNTIKSRAGNSNW